MNNDQFKLQIYHNRYTRGVVVSICKIIIWSLIYALVIIITTTVLAQDLSTQLYNAYSGPSAGTIFANLIIFAATVAYYWAVIYEIVHKIKQNRQLAEIENDYLSSGKLKN